MEYEWSLFGFRFLDSFSTLESRMFLSIHRAEVAYARPTVVSYIFFPARVSLSASEFLEYSYLAIETYSCHH
jgi:hypothetical protein